MPPNEGPSHRIWSQLPEGSRDVLGRTLAPTDLQSLLLDVARERAATVTPAALTQRWDSNRFVRPAGTDPRRLSALEARLWQLLPGDFDGVELSPVTPLGTCAALGAADQQRVVTTMRNSEVVSDHTNVLALEAARRRRAEPDAPVHLAACHRVLRAQNFGPGASSHFRLFALVSSARDQGSGRTEAALLAAHLTYWAKVLATFVPDRQPVLEYSVFDHPVLDERVADTVLPAVEADGGTSGTVDLVADPGRTRARGYYTAGALLIKAAGDELGDGGFTDWTAQLLADRKERCLISCLSTEGLLGLSAESQGPDAP
ncbi:hypothetical protein [Georgenia alba]|uniref:Uncharacterized protein n=1 Tax=Georgenia alba TaxID=2233858 RepID=A0ABW2QD56_9MICO